MTAGYTGVILLIMKTAVSIPDNVFEEAEITAQQLGLARSQLYTRAISEFIEHHNKNRITEKLNLIYTNSKDDSELGIHAIRKATQHDVW